jgi:NADH-quinone oxidoreductase subunit E
MSPSDVAAVEEPLTLDEVDAVIARYPEPTGALLSILEALQHQHPLKYLPEVTLRQVAERTGTPLSRIFSVVTFYSFFNLRPQGHHTIMVCRGTACHTRGSKRLMDSVLVEGGHDGGGEEEMYTTPDYTLTIRTVACFGQCALAPVVAVDETIHGHVSELQLCRMVRQLMESETPS